MRKTSASTFPQSVRQLLASDAPAFRRLHLEALEKHPTTFAMAYEDECHLPLSEFRSRLNELIVFGGFVNGALAGMATLQRHTLMKRRHVAMLWGMYVKDALRGSGLARSILQSVIQRAESEVDQLELYVALGNERARHFYRGWGFEPYGVMRRSLRVQAVDYDAEMMVKIFR